MRNLLFILVWYYKKVDKIILVKEKIMKFELVMMPLLIYLLFLLLICFVQNMPWRTQKPKTSIKTLFFFFFLVIFNFSFQHTLSGCCDGA